MAEHSAKRLLVAVQVVVLLLVCAQAWAGPTTANQARQVVRGWLRQDGSPLGTSLGASVARVETFTDVAGQALYYVVYLQPTGFVIVPADDEAEPVVCFAAAGTYDPSPANPLGALVSGDLPGRIKAVRGQAGAGPSAAQRSSCQGRWRQLSLLADAPVSMSGLVGVSDVRVAPFVQSRWNQQTENYQACYNYYTPPGAAGTATNYPSGCVATAMAQLMRFYQYPTIGIGVHPFTIRVGPDTDHLTAQQAYTRGGDGSGGPYNWALMMLDPDYTITPAQREAIGALCYDAGISCYGGSPSQTISYTPQGTGASLYDAKNSLLNTFDYSNGIYIYSGSLTQSLPLTDLYAMVNPNVDAGFPVLIGISGSAGGHAVIVDGYGYNASTAYHHLNMGWGSSQDAWYNLPNVDSAYYIFNVVRECVYNIYPAGSGEIISGRVTDPSGNPLSGLTVTAQRSGGGTYTALTGSSGVYALPRVPANSTYTITISSGTYAFPSRVASTTTSSDFSLNCGNYWGADLQGQPTTPPTAASGAAGTVAGRPIAVTLQASDDGLPNPPGALTYIVTSLPAHGSLADPGGGTIAAVPYVLLNRGNVVTYAPVAGYQGQDAFRFKANDGGTAPTGGGSAPATVTVNVNSVIYSVYMDTNPGWTLGSNWSWGTPTGGGSYNHDPTSGHTDNNVVGYNLGGNYGKITGTYYATTGAIDCRGYGNVKLTFWRWLGVGAPSSDNASIQVSSNGTNWTSVWSNAAEIQDTAWQYVEYDISSVADDQGSVYIRWGMGSTNNTGHYPGWNIDDVEVTGHAMPLQGDINGDGFVNVGDLQLLVATWGSGPGYAGPADLNGDGFVNVGDLQILVARWGQS